MRRTVAFITDYGTRDFYAAALRSRFLSLKSDYKLLDVTHEIEPRNILEAGYQAFAISQYLPKDSLLLCCVEGGRCSVDCLIRFRDIYIAAPDNGLLSFFLNHHDARVVCSLSRNTLAELRPDSFCSYHLDYDRFAGYLEDHSEEQDTDYPNNPTIIDEWLPCKNENRITARVISCDRFGNLVTGIYSEMIDSSALTGTVNDTAFRGLYSGYNQMPAHELCAYKGSSGFIELALNSDSAARTYNIKVNDVVEMKVED